MAEGRRKKLAIYDFDEFSRQDVTFYPPQCGYHGRSVKEVVVWTRTNFRRLNYRLVNLDTCRTVRQGQCKRIGENTWGRIDWIIDLNTVRAPGRYRLEITTSDGRTFRSTEVRIDDRCYGILLEKAAKHLFVKRCGVYCHTHDARVVSWTQNDFGRTLQHKDVVGGWHDAHDDNKWIGSTWNTVFGLCEVQQTLEPAWKGTNEPLPYALAEAKWEVEFLLKAQKADGSFYFGVFEWHPLRRKGRWINRVHTGDEPYDDLARDERVLLDVWDPVVMAERFGRPAAAAIDDGYAGYQDHAYLAAAMARFARAVAPHDRRLSQRCLRSARKTLEFLRRQSCPGIQYCNGHSGLALAGIELYLQQPSAASLKEIESHLREVLSLQEPRGHFRSRRDILGLEIEAPHSHDSWPFILFPYSYMMSLVRYLDLVPKGRLRGEAARALRRFADMAYRFTRYSSFGHLAEITLTGEPLLIRKGSSGAHVLSIASVLLAAGRILGVKKYVVAAEKNIHWMFGANPRAMSFMVDEGFRNIGQYACMHNGVARRRFAFYNHIRDDRWGMSSGIRGRGGAGTSEAVNYPHAGESMFRRYQHYGQETWLLITGWFLLAATEMARALGETQGKGS